MSAPIFPYATLRHPLRITFEEKALILDGPHGRTESDVPDADVDDVARTIDLREEEGLVAARLRVKVEANRSDVSSLPKDSNPQVILVARCGATNVRQGEKLEASEMDPAIWTGEIELDRRNYFGKVDLKAVLAADVRQPGHQFHGETEPWSLKFTDQPTRTPRGMLDVKWVNFRSDPAHPELRPFGKNPFYLDLSQASPIVYLNKDITKLPALLPERGEPKGRDKALYETIRMSIAESVWAALFNASLAGIVTGEGEVGPDWPAVEWQKQVLEKLLPYGFPDIEDGDERLEEADVAIRNNETGDIVSRVLAGIGKDIVKDEAKITRAINALEKEA